MPKKEKQSKTQECLAKSQVNWSGHTDITKWEGLSNSMVFFYLKLTKKKKKKVTLDKFP